MRPLPPALHTLVTAVSTTLATTVRPVLLATTAALHADPSTARVERWVPAMAPVLGCLGFVLAVRFPVLRYLPTGALLIAAASAAAAHHWGIGSIKLAGRCAVALVVAALGWWVPMWTFNGVSAQEQGDVVMSALVTGLVVMGVTLIAKAALSLAEPQAIPPAPRSTAADTH